MFGGLGVRVVASHVGTGTNRDRHPNRHPKTDGEDRNPDPPPFARMSDDHERFSPRQVGCGNRNRVG